MPSIRIRVGRLRFIGTFPEMKLLGANGSRIDINKWLNISRDLGGVKKEWQELQALTYQEKKESKSA